MFDVIFFPSFPPSHTISSPHRPWLIISAHHAPPGTATLPSAGLPMIVGSSAPRRRRRPLRRNRHIDAPPPPLPVGGPPPTPATRSTTTTTRDCYPNNASGGPSTSSRPTTIATSPNLRHSAPTQSFTTSRIPSATSPGGGRSCAPSFWIAIVTTTTRRRCS
jgi:hypothetical protein